MTQIVGFVGTKQSGKNTCCNFLVMLKLIENKVCRSARLNDDGEIEVTDIFGEGIKDQEWFAFKNPPVDTASLLNEMNVVKIYAVADDLKDFCIRMLGIPKEKVYGTDADKMELTNLLWENMPGVIVLEDNRDYDEIYGSLDSHGILENLLLLKKGGRMTIREVMQFVGTEIFRKFHPNIHVDSMMRRIERENPDLALICDVRFESEMTAIKNKGGILIGLKRKNSHSKDLHASEQVDFSLCDRVIENSKLSIPDQNREVYLALKQMKCKHLTDLGV